MGQENEKDEEEFASPESRGDFVEKPEEKEDDKKDDDEPTQEELDALKKDDDKKEDDDDKKEDDKKEDDDKKDDKARGIRVPKFRLDAALSRAREAEAKVLEMENTKPEPAPAAAAEETAPVKTPEQTLDESQSAIDEKITSAMADGDSKLVNELRAESRTLEREYNQNLMSESRTQTQTETQAQVTENATLDSVLDQLEEAFPIFNEQSKDFDADANAYVLRLQNNFIKGEGMSPSDALIEAVNVAIPALGLEVPGEEAEPDKTPKKPDNQTKENIDASKRQPPDTSDVGDDGDTGGMKDSDPNPMDLTEEEFDALPVETVKRMRGDFA